MATDGVSGEGSELKYVDEETNHGNWIRGMLGLLLFGFGLFGSVILDPVVRYPKFDTNIKSLKVQWHDANPEIARK